MHSQPLLNSPSTASALHRIGLGHHLGVQAGDASPRVVAALLHHPRVDHINHIVDSHRGLGNVGGQHHLAEPHRRANEGLMLLLGRHQTMEGDQLEVLPRSKKLQVQLGDVSPPGQENQDSAVPLGLLPVEIVDQIFNNIQIHRSGLPGSHRSEHPVGEVLILGPVVGSQLVPGLILLLLQGVVVVVSTLALFPSLRRLALALWGHVVEPLHSVLPVEGLHIKHPTLNVHGLQRHRPIHLHEIVRKIIRLQGG
mmetsp:Transcript_41206/g.89804  ORF Transcript_41206/g.89804 Transcript_41206/m.89804 type:complete len:253 (-) Transcript_41206:1033-1791(-)